MACCSVPWSVGLTQQQDVSIMWKSKLASQKHLRVFVDIPLQSEDSEALKCW